MAWAGQRLKSRTETSPTKSQTLVAAIPYLLASSQIICIILKLGPCTLCALNTAYYVILWHADSWGELQDIDMAIMIEVIEHLDPDVLE